MKKQIMQVLQFYIATEQPIAAGPQTITPEQAQHRHNLLAEEVEELEIASKQGDLAEVADGIVDCMYILLGTAIEHGIVHKITEMFDEVHRSNMSKIGADGLPIRRQDGKIMKGPNYSKPDLKKIIGNA